MYIYYGVNKQGNKPTSLRINASFWTHINVIWPHLSTLQKDPGIDKWQMGSMQIGLMMTQGRSCSSLPHISLSLFPITAACPNPNSLKRGEGADDVKPPSGQTMMANREMVVNIYDANKVVKSFSTLCSPHNIFSMLPWVGQTLIKFARSRLLSKSVTSMINHNQRWWQGSGWGRRGQWINRGGGDG